MEQQNIKILHQSLKTKWYRMIEAYIKPEEYREATHYWCKRFLGVDGLAIAYRLGTRDVNKAGYTHVQFSLGYPKKDDESRRMTFELNGIFTVKVVRNGAQRKERNILSRYLADVPHLTGQNYWRNE